MVRAGMGLLLTSLAAAAAAAAAAVLYEDDALVLAVRDFTLIATANAAGTYHLVEFFAGWWAAHSAHARTPPTRAPRALSLARTRRCSHCNAFAPTFSRAAASACAARPALRFGAVDCVADFLVCAQASHEPRMRP